MIWSNKASNMSFFKSVALHKTKQKLSIILNSLKLSLVGFNKLIDKPYCLCMISIFYHGKEVIFSNKHAKCMHVLLKGDVFMIMNTCLLHNTQNINLNLWQRLNDWDEKFLCDEKKSIRIYIYVWTYLLNSHI